MINLRNIIKYKKDSLLLTVLFLSSLVAIFITIGIVYSLISETWAFFNIVNPIHFLTSMTWSTQSMVHDGILADERAFGMLPLLMGTLLITLVSLLIAIPLGILSAIYMVEYASHKQRSLIKPLLEALAGIPTIVYGFFAIMIVSPLLNTTGELFNLHISSESALAAGLVMGIMIIPFISSLADDAMRSVPSRIRDGALALGSTRYEVIRYVIIPASSSSLISAFLLATSRAIGETMIVVMAAGLSANMTANPFEAVTTITVQIVKLLTGDQSFHSPKTLVAFALGTLLFCITLLFNLIAIRTAKKYHKKYD